MLLQDAATSSDPYAQWDSLVEPATPTTEEPDFECRICLEVPPDPCVTRCGHLYCQTCLSQWLAFSPKCPACKTHSSMSQVVPIFGARSASRPSSPTDSKKRRGLHSKHASTSTASYDFEHDSERRRIPAFARLGSLSPSDISTSPSSSIRPELSPRPDRRPLLAPPPPITFTQEPRIVSADEPEHEWDTDAELDFQLNQLNGRALNKAPPLPEATADDRQPFSKALSIAALALLLTALLNK